MKEIILDLAKKRRKKTPPLFFADGKLLWNELNVYLFMIYVCIKVNIHINENLKSRMKRLVTTVYLC